MFKMVLTAVAAAVLFASAAYAGVKEADVAREIINMRSSLARNFVKPGAQVTEETFRQVCGAVAKRVKEISEKERIIIRHAAVKYRSRANAPTFDESEIINRFAANKDLKEYQDAVRIKAKTYSRLSVPIYVEDACLACHGARDKRPSFIVSKYADDRAYDFRTGDLRGIISVLVPANR